MDWVHDNEATAATAATAVAALDAATADMFARFAPYIESYDGKYSKPEKAVVQDLLLAEMKMEPEFSAFVIDALLFKAKKQAVELSYEQARDAPLDTLAAVWVVETYNTDRLPLKRATCEEVHSPPPPPRPRPRRPPPPPPRRNPRRNPTTLEQDVQALYEQRMLPENTGVAVANTVGQAHLFIPYTGVHLDALHATPTGVRNTPPPLRRKGCPFPHPPAHAEHHGGTTLTREPDTHTHTHREAPCPCSPCGRSSSSSSRTSRCR